MESFAGVVEQFEAEGPGDWTEHEDWESAFGWAKKLSAEVRVAAKLFAREIQPYRIEQMMELPEGQVERWWEGSEEFQRAARASFWERRERAARLDPTKALTPKQLKAAEAYFVDAESQKEAAMAAGVSARTIRNWLKDPVFTYYGEQLRRQRAEELAREREAQQARTSGRYLAQVEKALDVIDEKLEEKDRTVALAVARPYMRPPR